MQTSAGTCVADAGGASHNLASEQFRTAERPCGQTRIASECTGLGAALSAKGTNTNTHKLSAAIADGARLPLRTVLMCSRLVLRLCAMAATRDATDPCASRLCLLSMARALPAERLLRKRLPHVRHTETAMRTLLGARTEVVELQTSQYCMRRVHCNIHARMHGMRQMLQLCYNIA